MNTIYVDKNHLAVEYMTYGWMECQVFHLFSIEMLGEIYGRIIETYAIRYNRVGLMIWTF